MEIPVLIEKVGSNGYRVSSTAPFPFAVEAPTREEALDKVRELFEKRAAEGAEVGSLSLDRPARHAYLAEYRPDDPRIQEWKAAMEAYRDLIDAEEGP